MAYTNMSEEKATSGDISQTSSKSISANTWTEILSKTFSSDEYGTYIAIGVANIFSSSSAARYLLVGSSKAAVSSAPQFMPVVTSIVKVDANNKTIKMQAQSSIASTVADGRLSWIRIS